MAGKTNIGRSVFARPPNDRMELTAPRGAAGRRIASVAACAFRAPAPQLIRVLDRFWRPRAAAP